MKKLLSLLAICIANVCFAQSDREIKTEPFKGAKTIISYYSTSTDSLFSKISKDLIVAGYNIAKRDKELLLITTDDRPIKQINYNVKLVINENKVLTTALYKSTIGYQIGYVKSEPGVEELKYTGKAFVTRNAFDQIISFIESTHPDKIEYSK